MFTTNNELRKLIYLYLLQTPDIEDQLLLSINCFMKDTRSDLPLIRAQSLRTMSSLDSPIVSQYLFEPIKRLVSDPDPFVRKSAVNAACKFCCRQNIDNEQDAEDIIEQIKQLLLDGNQAVLSCACQFFNEINQIQKYQIKCEFNQDIFQSVLAGISQCNEYGLISLFSFLSNFYQPQDQFQLQSTIQKISEKLNSKNSGVVIGAIGILLKLSEYQMEQNETNQLSYRISSSLNSLLCNQVSELCYISCLKVIDVLAAYGCQYISIQARAALPKFQDKSCVKKEKLIICIQIANQQNGIEILDELSDNALQEVDRAVAANIIEAIGKIGIKVPELTNYAVQKLVGLVYTVSNNTDQMQEQVEVDVDNNNTTTYSVITEAALIAVYHIIQAYPNDYNAAIIPILANLQNLNNNQTKIALLKICEAFCQNIENAEDIIEDFIDDFENLAEEVQLALLTSVVKIYLIYQTPKSQERVQTTLQKAQKSLFIDVVERSWFYTRLMDKAQQGSKTAPVPQQNQQNQQTLDFNLMGQWLFQQQTIDKDRFIGAVDSQIAYNRCKSIEKMQIKQQGLIFKKVNKEEVKHVKRFQAYDDQTLDQPVQVQQQVQQEAPKQEQKVVQQETQQIQVQQEQQQVQEQAQQPQEQQMQQPQQTQEAFDPFADIFK